MNLVPVGELKPRDFCCTQRGLRCEVVRIDPHDGNVLCLVFECGRFNLNWFTLGTEVTPLPDCDSFDWQPPREPTALELAKEMLQSFPREGSYFEACERLIAAMEREAKQ